MSHPEELVPARKRRLSVTRRRFIKFSSLSTILAALPFRVGRAATIFSSEDAVQNVSPLMQQLSAYMGGANTRALPDDVVELLRPPLARDNLVRHEIADCRFLIADSRLQIEPRPGVSCGTCQDLLSAAAFRP